MLARLEVNLPPPHRLQSTLLCLSSKQPNILSHPHKHSLSTPTYTNLWLESPDFSSFAHDCQRQSFQSNLMHLPHQLIQLCLSVKYTELCGEYFSRLFMPCSSSERQFLSLDCFWHPRLTVNSYFNRWMLRKRRSFNHALPYRTGNMERVYEEKRHCCETPQASERCWKRWRKALSSVWHFL